MIPEIFLEDKWQIMSLNPLVLRTETKNFDPRSQDMNREDILRIAQIHGYSILVENERAYYIIESPEEIVYTFCILNDFSKEDWDYPGGNLKLKDEKWIVK